MATDQALLLTQARNNGFAGLIDMPGVPAINLLLGLFDYKPSKQVVDEATKLQTKFIEAKGAQGKQLLNDIDTYAAGMNARLQASGSTTPKVTRSDIYSLNAIKAQFLGEGGGEEVDNAQFLDALRRKLGTKEGDKAFEDLRARNDPEATVHDGQGGAEPDRRRRCRSRRGWCASRAARSRTRSSSSPAPRRRPRASPAPASASSRRTS